MFRILEGRARYFITLDSLTFGGDDGNPYEWTSRIDEYFTLRNLSDEQRLSLVFYHLEGKALAWFMWLEKNCLLMSRSIFLQMVKFRFESKFESGLEGLKLVMNKEGNELKCSELETRAKKVDDLVDSNAAIEIVENDSLLDYVETKVVENAVVENMEAVTDSKLETEFVEVSAGKLGYKMDMNDTHFVLQFETIRKGRIMSLGAKFIENFSRCFALVLEEKSIIVGGISYIVIRRRGAVLTLYALEEVYKEFLSLQATLRTRWF